MKFAVYKDADSVAHAAASTITADARAAIASRGLFALAVSGGHTPWVMLRALAEGELPRSGVHGFPGGGRVAPARGPDPDPSHLPEKPPQPSALPSEPNQV